MTRCDTGGSDQAGRLRLRLQDRAMFRMRNADHLTGAFTQGLVAQMRDPPFGDDAIGIAGPKCGRAAETRDHARNRSTLGA